MSSRVASVPLSESKAKISGVFDRGNQNSYRRKKGKNSGEFLKCLSTNARSMEDKQKDLETLLHKQNYDFIRKT